MRRATIGAWLTFRFVIEREIWKILCNNINKYCFTLIRWTVITLFLAESLVLLWVEHMMKAGLSNIVSTHSNINVSTSKHQVSSYENRIHKVSLQCKFSDAKLNAKNLLSQFTNITFVRFLSSVSSLMQC